MRNTYCLRYLRVVLTTTLIASAASLQAAPSIPSPPQAFVKVNQLYFLYTYPVVPYLTQKGTLMVGLEGMGCGLFDKAPEGDANAAFLGGYDYGHVTTNASARTETLALGTHAVTFTAGSRTAQADGKGVPMGAAVWDAPTHQMVVPAFALAQCLSLPAHWDRQRRVLFISGPDVLTLSDTVITSNLPTSFDTTSMVPARTTLHPNDAPRTADYVECHPDRRRLPWLMIEMKNISIEAVGVNFDYHIKILYSRGASSGDLGDSPNRHGLIGSGRWRYTLALQTDLDWGVPLCVVSCPVSSVPVSSKVP